MEIHVDTNPAELKQRERYFRSLIEHALDGVIVIDENREISYVSPTIERVLGFTGEELIGRSISDFEHIEKSEARAHAFAEVIANPGVTIPVQMRLPHKDGGYRDVFAVSTNLLHDPAVRGVVVNLHDITDSRAAELALYASERRYRSLIEQAMDAIIVTDRAQMVRDVNHAACELLGADTKRMLHGRSIQELFSTNHVLSEADMSSLLLRGERVTGTAAVRRADGVLVPVEFAAALVYDDEIEWILRDISLRLEWETELRRSRDDLRNLARSSERRVEEERRRLARDVHDTIGQSITALKLDLAWLRKHVPASCRPDFAERLAAMEIVLREASRTARRISTELRPGMLDDLGLGPTVEWYAEELSKRAGIEISTAVEELAECPSTEVSTALFRILQEALTNVVRHAGATRVAIAVVQQPSGVILEVRDNGCGIPHQHATRGGLGILGMRERAYAIGGSVTLERIPAGGTLFPEGGTLVRAEVPAVEASAVL